MYLGHLQFIFDRLLVDKTFLVCKLHSTESKTSSLSAPLLPDPPDHTF
jgi:hypothetical protein